MFKLAGIFACIGIGVSLLLTAAWKAASLVHLSAARNVLVSLFILLWPASSRLMAIHGGSTTLDIILIYTALILANGILYGLVGLVVGAIMATIKPRRE